jgi:hypothetical protein
MSDMQTREQDAMHARRALERELSERDNEQPVKIGRHAKVCGDIGPRIGDDGSPRCGRVMNHQGYHRTNVEWSGFNDAWPGKAQGAWDQTDQDYRDHFTGPVIP